jgi:hypothetical protein
MTDGGLRRDLPRALLLVWLVLGAATGFAALAPLVLPSPFLLRLFPVCPSKAAGFECVLCGMTTAFVRIGSGDLAGALRAHRGSVAVYCAFVLNFCGAAAYTMMRAKPHANT